MQFIHASNLRRRFPASSIQSKLRPRSVRRFSRQNKNSIQTVLKRVRKWSKCRAKCQSKVTPLNGVRVIRGNRDFTVEKSFWSSLFWVELRQQQQRKWWKNSSRLCTSICSCGGSSCYGCCVRVFSCASCFIQESRHRHQGAIERVQCIACVDKNMLWLCGARGVYYDSKLEPKASQPKLVCGGKIGPECSGPKWRK